MFFKNSKDEQFFRLLRSAAENAVDCSNIMTQLLNDPTRHPDLQPRVKDLEKKGDNLTHDLYSLINKSFITPLEREDLVAIATSVDSVVDGMEAAAARIAIYKVSQSDRFLKEFANILRLQCAQIVAAVDLAAGNKLDQIHDQLVQINQLENQGDEILREGISFWFENATNDPVKFIVMKELYDTLESTTDRAEDVANTLEGVVMKNA